MVTGTGGRWALSRWVRPDGAAGEQEHHVMWQMHDGWGWWMAFGWLWMVALWGLIIWAVFAVVSRLEHRPPQEPPQNEETALAILERRYARGELTSEQFEEMRRRLTSNGGPTAHAA